MNKFAVIAIGFVSVLVGSVPAFGAKAVPAHESWKGSSPAHEFTVGVLGGMAIQGPNVGGVLLGTIAKKIIDRGFAPDINDQVFLEVQAGPQFTLGTTFFGVSTHLRWDFHQDEDFTLYGLGGVSGLFGNFLTQFAPRFGIGAFWNFDVFALRAEISNNWITAGASFPF